MKHFIIVTLAVALTVPAFAKGGRGGGGHSSGSHSSASHVSTSHVSHAPATGIGANAAHDHVSSYNKKDGTHVQSHERSTKDDTKTNNWSTKGNTNPVTGKAGTK